MDVSEFFGRQLLSSELPVGWKERVSKLQVQPGIEVMATTVRCNRCGVTTTKQRCTLPNNQFYCPSCIQLGRVSTLNSLVSLPEPNRFERINQKDVLTWKGTLSKTQDKCATDILTVFQERRQHLLWAVTGAGKTEMLFRGIAWALSQGLRVGLASPRIDVCNELFPRLVQAFKRTDIQLLHGRSDIPYRYCQFTICTTHQLLRFKVAFDVLIIDEVDAFPFAQDDGLWFAAQQAKKADGALLFLTATPGKKLFQMIQRKELSISYLPLRYHGHLLPTITCRLASKWQLKLEKGRLPRSLIVQMQQRLKHNIRFLLFVPHVAQLPAVQTSLQHTFPNEQIVTVHAGDPDRLEKVQLMRSEEINFLVTTTILERGVTFPGIDVFVLGADDAVFSSAALVQIAGRAGRNVARPTGDVIFFGASRLHQTYWRPSNKLST